MNSVWCMSTKLHPSNYHKYIVQINISQANFKGVPSKVAIEEIKFHV